jgi:MFS family permease
MYRADMRGRSIAIASVLPYLGPALGPIIGGIASQKLHWHWLFWIISGFAAVIILTGFFFLPETYTPVLLERKAAAENPDSRRDLSPLTKEFYHDLLPRLKVNVYRPFRLLFKSPVIQIMAVAFAVDFGIYTLMLGTFAQLWQDRYHENQFISSLNYTSIAVGTTLSSQIGGRLMDWSWAYLTAKYKTSRPEFRCHYMAPTVVISIGGLLWYGWSAEMTAHWAVVDVGVTVYILGVWMWYSGLAAYTYDAFEYAASANAAIRMLSNIGGFAFPIFGPALFQRLGYGWGNSLLTLLFLIFCAPVPLIFWIWGPKWRKIAVE